VDAFHDPAPISKKAGSLGCAVVVALGFANHGENNHVAEFGADRVFGADHFDALGSGFCEKPVALGNADRLGGLGDFGFRALVELSNHDFLL